MNCNKLRFVTSHCITLHDVTLRYVTLRYITLHYVTLRCVTLRYVTLQDLFDDRSKPTQSKSTLVLARDHSTSHLDDDSLGVLEVPSVDDRLAKWRRETQLTADDRIHGE